MKPKYKEYDNYYPFMLLFVWIISTILATSISKDVTVPIGAGVLYIWILLL